MKDCTAIFNYIDKEKYPKADILLEILTAISLESYIIYELDKLTVGKDGVYSNIGIAMLCIFIKELHKEDFDLDTFIKAWTNNEEGQKIILPQLIDFLYPLIKGIEVSNGNI